jgi:MFS family permease
MSRIMRRFTLPGRNRRPPELPFHYGWVIVLAGTLAIFACLGIGRFALGMLLPSMGAGLGLSYAEMGFISTGNFVGYLAAVLVCGHLVARFGYRPLIFAALAGVGISLILVSRASGFHQVLVIYLLTGFASGASNVPVMALVSHWFARRRRGRAAGFIVIGSGFAIMFTGLLVPAVNAAYGAEGWRVSWLVLGAMVLVIAAVCGLLLRDDPGPMGLAPVGQGPGSPAGAAHEAPEEDPSRRRQLLLHLGAIYFAFGFTYVIYATFIVTTLVEEWGFSEAAAGRFWVWVGLLSLLSGPVFGTFSDRFGRRSGLGTVFALQMIAYLLVALQLPQPFLYLSIACFGLVAWSIPSIMAATVGDYMGPAHAAAAFGYITFFFGIGQVAGPALAGVLAEASGSFSSSYFMAAAVVAMAVVLTALLRRPATQ